jgi:hypothetical protein
MQNLGSPGRRIFWCSGCGSLKEETGDFHRVEMPLDLQHVLRTALITPGRPNEVQFNQVKGMFCVRQDGKNHPTIELHLYEATGRRAY